MKNLGFALYEGLFNRNIWINNQIISHHFLQFVFLAFQKYYAMQRFLLSYVNIKYILFRQMT